MTSPAAASVAASPPSLLSSILYDQTPHYCPVEIFQALPEQHKQPLHETMIKVLRTKFHQLEVELQQEHVAKLETIKCEMKFSFLQPQNFCLSYHLSIDLFTSCYHCRCTNQNLTEHLQCRFFVLMNKFDVYNVLKAELLLQQAVAAQNVPFSRRLACSC